MPGEPIHLDRSPYNGRLLAWGRAPGGWWGLVEFAQRVRRDGHLEQLTIAAWLPASALSRPVWAGKRPAQLTRVTLSLEQTAWPAPAAWNGLFVGAWAGGTLRLPDGYEAVAGAAWRRDHGSS